MAVASRHRVAGVEPGRLGGGAAPVLHVDALDDGRSSSEGVARHGGGANRRRAVEAADERLYVPRRSGGGPAQQRGGDGDPSGSVVPKDQRGSEVLDRSLGTRALAHDLPDLPEAQHVVCDSAQGRAGREGVSGVRNSVSPATKLSSYSSSTQKGQEFAYSGVWWAYASASTTFSKTVYMGIYGENFTWRNHTGHYSYFINWNVSYNWSLAMGGDAWYDCVGSASANLI